MREMRISRFIPRLVHQTVASSLLFQATSLFSIEEKVTHPPEPVKTSNQKWWPFTKKRSSPKQSARADQAPEQLHKEKKVEKEAARKTRHFQVDENMANMSLECLITQSLFDQFYAVQLSEEQLSHLKLFPLNSLEKLEPTPFSANITPEQRTSFSRMPIQLAARRSHSTKRKKLLVDTRESDREALYRELFNSPPPAPPRDIPTKLMINGESAGQLHITFSKDQDNFTFPSDELLSPLVEFLNQESYLALIGYENKGQLDWEALITEGLEPNFIRSPPTLNILIPFDRLTTQQHYLDGHKRVDISRLNVHREATLSGFINYRFENSANLPGMQSASTAGAPRSDAIYEINNDPLYNQNIKWRDPLFGQLDGALVWKKQTFESLFAYKEVNTHPIQRQRSRLVSDVNNYQNKLVIGDLTYPTESGMAFVDMGGISFSKDYSSLPYYHSYYPSGEHAFFLEEPSQIEIWINGTLTRTLHLKSGYHQLSSLPLIDGANNVELKIINALGQVQNIAIDLYRDRALLQPGQSQYSFNLGLPSVPQGADRRYDTRHPFASLSYRLGVNERLTASTYLQANSNQKFIGASFSQLFPMVRIRLETNLSHLRHQNPDFYTSLIFSNVAFENRLIPIAWRFFGSYTGKNYQTIGQALPTNPFRYALGGGLQLSLPWKWNLSFSGTCSYPYPGQTKSYSLNTFLSHQLGKWIRVNFGLREEKASNCNSTQHFVFGLTFSKAIRGVQATSRLSLHDHYQGVDFAANYSPPLDAADNRARFSSVVSHANDQVNSIHAVDYTSDRALARLSYSTQFNQTPKGADPSVPITQSQPVRMHASIAGAVVFADGNFALSRPIGAGGFAIVKGIKNLKAKKISLHPNYFGNAEVCSSAIWGPAVTTRLNCYQTSQLSLEIDSPPPGFDYRKNQFKLFPHYRQGYLIEIGSDHLTCLQATLVDQEGNPLDHAAIIIQSIENPNESPLYTFTGKRGHFTSGGLSSGEYSLLPVLNDRKFTPLYITIPEEVKDLHKLGKLEVEELI